MHSGELELVMGFRLEGLVIDLNAGNTGFHMYTRPSCPICEASRCCLKADCEALVLPKCYIGL